MRSSGLALVLICLLICATGTAASAQVRASADGAPHGRLVQARGVSGCVNATGAVGCGRARGIGAPSDVALSPDGRNAYVAGFGSNSVAIFRRNRRTGSLTQLSGRQGCIVHQRRGACEFGRALGSPVSVAVSPDGRNVYVVSSGSDALSIFARNRRSGALRQLSGPRGCLSNFPGGGCRDGRALNEPSKVAVSRDGKRVYVAARSHPSAVAVLARAADGTISQATGPGGCVSSGGAAGCTPGRGLSVPWDLEVSPDGRNVYVASSASNGVAVLVRTPAGLTQAADATGCVALTAREGCAVGRALGDPSGVAVSPDGRSVYLAAFGGDALAIFRRSSGTGSLSQAPGAAGCVKQSGGSGCRAGRVLDGVHDAVVSPDGRNVYAVTEQINAMSVFGRDPGSGSLRQLPGRWACFIKGGVLGCPAGRGLTTAVAVAISRDGRNVYTVSAEKNGAVGIFRVQ
jgi:DNA-binding beta-propeller fold protein YncE